jgi:hypothetical protein
MYLKYDFDLSFGFVTSFCSQLSPSVDNHVARTDNEFTLFGGGFIYNVASFFPGLDDEGFTRKDVGSESASHLLHEVGIFFEKGLLADTCSEAKEAESV